MKREVKNTAGEIEKGGCVVVDVRGRILLVKNLESGDPWGLPKGHVEPGENIVRAAVRETREETGLDVQLVRQLPDLTYKHGRTGQPIRLHLWLARPTQNHADAEPEERHAWVSLDEAKHRVFPDVAQHLERIRRLIVVD
jgi:ADP-ribose pyrophosphatase YjhB (NUDIX family)